MKSKAFLKTIKDRVILDVGPMEFEPGKIYVVMGSNGSGKTTFAKCLALEKGLEDKDCVTGYMPQKNFAFRMNVLKNLMLTAGSESDAMLYLQKLGMEKLEGSNAKALSGGETAKLALARVLLTKVNFLILDEPTSAMDTESALASEGLIKEYAEQNNAAVILITHSQGQARRIGDELIFFHNGKVLESGPVAEILDNPQTKEAKQFFAM